MNKIYGIISLISFIMGLLLIKIFNNGGFIRGFAGDFLVVIFIYCSIKTIIELKPLYCFFIVVAISYIIEILQYFNLIDYLGLTNSRAAQLILGNRFDPLDLIAYALGSLLIYLIDKKYINNIKRAN